MKKVILCLLTMLFLLQPVAFASELSGWAENEYIAASRAGLISYNIVINNMQENITREEFCDLAINLYSALSESPLPTPDTLPFEDSNSYSVAQAYSLQIVSGVSDTEFAPDALITREQLAKMLTSTLLKCDFEINLSKNDKKLLQAFDDGDTVQDWAVNSVITLLKLEILNGMDEDTLAPTGNATREQAIALVNRTYESFKENSEKPTLPTITSPKAGSTITKDIAFKWPSIKNAEKYRLIIKDSNGNAKIIYTTKRTTAEIPLSKFENGESYSAILQAEVSGKKYFSLPVEFSVKQSTSASSSSSQTATSDSSARKPATTDKELRVFDSGFYFADKEEARQYMKDIVVDVWKIDSNGEKYASTLELTVNKNLAEDVKAIFKEIFEDEEKFPIKSAGGFQWRNTASGRLSQHSYGTCIDINPNENYYVSTSGAALSGSYWKPNEDPYSVTEDGIVVRTFAKYGFLWGGNAWGAHSAKDYMHFTYLGN